MIFRYIHFPFRSAIFTLFLLKRLLARHKAELEIKNEGTIWKNRNIFDVL